MNARPRNELNTSAVSTQDTSTHNGHVNLGKTERILFIVGGSALTTYGVTRRSNKGVLITALGAGLLHSGISGYCSVFEIARKRHSERIEHRPARDVHVEKAVTIDKTPEELYRFWRNFQNLPRFMKHLESVTPLNQERSHWVAKGPAGTTIEWDAEIYNEKENELISWRSLEGSHIDNAGTVRFERAPGGRGTYVRVTLNYNIPGGRVSALIAKLFGDEPGQLVEEDLRRFKQLVEAGEIATTAGQPSGRSPEATQLPQRKPSKRAEERELAPELRRAAGAA